MGNTTKERSEDVEIVQKQSEYLRDFATLCARQMATVYAILSECDDISLENGLEAALRQLVQSREIAQKTLADYQRRYDQLFFQLKTIKNAA